MKIRSVTTKILAITLLVLVTLAAGLMFVMTYFMNSLTDNIMLSMLQPMAKTAAQSVEGNLHTLAERFFLIRENQIFLSEKAAVKEKQGMLDRATAGLEFVWVGIYETDGSLLTGSPECPQNISGRPMYRSMRATGNLVIEDTSIGTGGLEIVMGVPIINEGNPSGAPAAASPRGCYLVGSYRYDVLSDVLRNINIGPNGSAFIINENGEILAHRDLGKVFSRAPVADSLGIATHEVLQGMRQGQTGSAAIREAHDEMFVSYAPVRGTLWALGILAPRSDFTASARQAVTSGAAIIAVCILFLGILVSLFIGKMLSSPLSALTENAHKLSLGQLDDKHPQGLTARNDEIGDLAKAFASMSGTIRNAVRDIWQLTWIARTGNLKQRVDASIYQGDYRLIISGMNVALDVFCAQLDTMPGALMLLNETREPLHCNRAMREVLLRHGISENRADTLAVILSPEDCGDLPLEAARLFSREDGLNAGPFRADVALKDSGGVTRTYTLNLQRMDEANASGGPAEKTVCVMLILNDVTMLTRAKVDAEAASRAKSDFLSRMSHEMRTPMNAIMGMASIGRASADPERKEYCLGKISEASQHLLGVINDILDMSKIEADKFELSYSEFNLEKLLQRVTGVINFRVEEKSQNLFINIDKNLPVNIVSDEQRLAQVITNLLSNAMKFTPEGGTITLKVCMTAESDGVCSIRVEVKDTGIGISEEQQKRLFTSFEQADGSISRQFGGTGLGLAISKRIVTLMDGRIWIESEIGKGSSFIFEIKAARGCAPQPDASRTGVDWHRLRVLVVDDAPELLEFFKAVLTPYGTLCETVLCGEEALALIRDGHAYDIAFVDLRMPGMDGIELVRRIGESAGSAQAGQMPQVVLITAGDWAEREEEARSAGVGRFLQKPLFPSMLIDSIHESLQHREQEREVLPEQKSSDGIFAGKRILLAEDVEINREIALALIEHTGVEIDFAFDGGEAVERFSAAPEGYALILMDVHMPQVDGYEATGRIRASGLSGAETIPIIAMTANVFREDIERCLAAGMNGHLGKPIDVDEFVAMLRRYLL